MEAFRAVVCADIKVVAHGGHLVLVDKQAGVLGPDDHIHRHAHAMQILHLRVDRCGADASRYEDVPLAGKLPAGHPGEIRRHPERPYHIAE